MSMALVDRALRAREFGDDVKAPAQDEEFVLSHSDNVQKRLALCRTLLHDPELVILDEPYSALDAAGGEVLDGELESLARTRTLVVSTHDPTRIQALTTQAVVLT
jgi:ABC-type multidrug transport system ATPase subunit